MSRKPPWGTCQRCGFNYPLPTLRKEWTGLMVCPEDFDPRPAELRAPPMKPEGVPLRNASPEPAPLYSENVGTNLANVLTGEDGVPLLNEDGTYILIEGQ